MLVTVFPTIESERLVMREIVTADGPALFAIHSDAEAMRWFGTDPLTELVQMEKVIEAFAGLRHLPNPGVRWGLESKASGRLIGSCGLFRWNRSWKSCVIGYELGKAEWGKGLMSEAMAATLTWGFAHMELHRVEAQVHPQNAASIRLVRRFGFVQEGLLREAGFWHGQRQDMLQFALLKREYRPPLSAR